MKLRELLWLRRDGTAPVPILCLYYFLLLLLVSAACCFVLQKVDYAWNWEGVIGYRQLFIQGWITTIWVSAASMVLSLFFGTIAALCSQSRLIVLRCSSLLYVEAIRGTPLLVQILIFFYLIFNVLQLENRYVAGILILSIFTGGYVTEIIRSSIQSIGKTQWESARAVGFTTRQTYRYIIFPQAFRVMLPPLSGELVSLIKNSSLLYTIAIKEFTANAKDVASFTYANFESYIPLAVGYLILTLPISFWSRALEHKNRFET